MTLLTIEEVAAEFVAPVGTLRYWRYAGTGPRSIKVGRHVRYRREDVDAWLEAKATSATRSDGTRTSA